MLRLWSSPQSSFGHSRIQTTAAELRNMLSWLLEGQDGPKVPVDQLGDLGERAFKWHTSSRIASEPSS